MGIFVKVRKVSKAIGRNIVEDIKRSRREAPQRRASEIDRLKQQLQIQKLKGQLHREKARTPSGLESFLGMQPPKATQPTTRKKKKRKKSKKGKKQKRTFTISV